ncbi:MAG: asparagine synthase (glutamine-hydrolyzing), partial [bacterium]
DTLGVEMCGFAGYLGRARGLDVHGEQHLLGLMAESIRHRGPDSSGIWLDTQQGIGFGYRRLSIIDLSIAGQQPMVSHSGRYVISFNGEIYNHLELRAELERSEKGVEWRGHSDTETLVAGFDHWGVLNTISRAVGMFAIALWDRELETLTLIRDRFGEKPLYYGYQGEGERKTFLFGSELKALKPHPAFEGVVDIPALTQYIRFGYIPAPFSIYKGISKLQPGFILEVSLRSFEPIIMPYWSFRSKAIEGSNKPFPGDPTEAVNELDRLLTQSIKQQMVADVPLGAFLSGGVDSSAIVAIMQNNSNRPIKTFTIGFRESEYDEAKYANAVARHIGTEHHELYITPAEAQSVIPRLPIIYDEPFADSSQIPTFLVSEFAKRHVTVSLSGDAGDELFGGYNRYIFANSYWNYIKIVPTHLRSWIAGKLLCRPQHEWSLLINKYKKLLLGARIPSSPGDKVHKIANVLRCQNISDYYATVTSTWIDPSSLVVDSTQSDFSANTTLNDKLDIVSSLMEMDTLHYLPDDILVKVDRASMAVSLESRVPMLDHRLAEFSCTLSTAIKLRSAESKWPLRQILYKHVPKPLLERPKMGFGVPLGDWLRGPLRQWAEELLDPIRIEKEGYLKSVPIRQKWEEHINNKKDWSHQLWIILMFQAWLNENINCSK